MYVNAQKCATFHIPLVMSGASWPSVLYFMDYSSEKFWSYRHPKSLAKCGSAPHFSCGSLTPTRYTGSRADPGQVHRREVGGRQSGSIVRWVAAGAWCGHLPQHGEWAALQKETTPVWKVNAEDSREPRREKELHSLLDSQSSVQKHPRSPKAWTPCPPSFFSATVSAVRPGGQGQEGGGKLPGSC